MRDFCSLAPEAEQKIKSMLDQCRLRWAKAEEPQTIFGSLQLLNPASLDVVAIHNTDGSNRMIHLGIPFPTFSLGFDAAGNLTSRAIFGAALHKGTDHCIVSDPLLLVFRTHTAFTRFTQSLAMPGLQ